MEKKLCWNVYRYDITTKMIYVCNIFLHEEIDREIKEALKKCKTKEEFARKAKSILMCYCWAKYEWEVVISPFTSSENPHQMKVDAYDQIENNWEPFIDYLWSQR